MLGTHREARKALTVTRAIMRLYNSGEFGIFTRICADGKESTSFQWEDWAMIGWGAYRMVVRSPSGNVYKVHNYKYGDPADSWTDSVNGREYLRFLELSNKCPDRIRFPNMTRFLIGQECVLAVEEIKGDHQQDSPVPLPEVLYDWTFKVGIGDMHGRNIMVESDGTFVIIDFGS